MAKNLVYRLSPVHVGLSVQPDWPAAADVMSGDLCRVGNAFAVCLVDHQEGLAGGRHRAQEPNTDRRMFHSSVPVLDFTLNVWEFDLPLGTSIGANHDLKGTTVYHYDTTNPGITDSEIATIGLIDTSGADANFSAYAATVDASAVTAVGRRVVGTILSAPISSGTLAEGVSVRVQVLMGN